MPWGVGAGAASGRGCSGLMGSRRGSVGVAPGATASHTPASHTPGEMGVLGVRVNVFRAGVQAAPAIPNLSLPSSPGGKGELADRLSCRRWHLVTRVTSSAQRLPPDPCDVTCDRPLGRELALLPRNCSRTALMETVLPHLATPPPVQSAPQPCHLGNGASRKGKQQGTPCL